VSGVLGIASPDGRVRAEGGGVGELIGAIAAHRAEQDEDDDEAEKNARRLRCPGWFEVDARQERRAGTAWIRRWRSRNMPKPVRARPPPGSREAPYRRGFRYRGWAGRSHVDDERMMILARAMAAKASPERLR